MENPPIYRWVLEMVGSENMAACSPALPAAEEKSAFVRSGLDTAFAKKLKLKLNLLRVD